MHTLRFGHQWRVDATFERRAVNIVLSERPWRVLFQVIFDCVIILRSILLPLAARHY